jgi:hypothetical protein
MVFFPTNKIYNEQYKILFKFDPTAQCILGQFEGWQMVLQIFNDCREFDKEKDKVEFVYTQHRWDKLLKYIKNKLNV